MNRNDALVGQDSAFASLEVNERTAINKTQWAAPLVQSLNGKDTETGKTTYFAIEGDLTNGNNIGPS